MSDRTRPVKLTHLDDEGRARMVDVGAKPETRRRARASAVVRVSAVAHQALLLDALPKGSAEEVVRLAAIQGAKQTSLLIPLCHPLRITGIEVRLHEVPSTAGGGLWRIEAEVSAVDRSGVEMEAMTAASVGALALYDMVKGVDRSAAVVGVELHEKEGGKSGHWRREATES